MLVWGASSAQHRIRAGTGQNDEANDIYYLGNLGGDMQRCVFALFASCHSAVDGPYGNLVETLTGTNGVDCAIGMFWDQATPATEARDNGMKYFVTEFWKLAMRGDPPMTVYDAMIAARDYSRNLCDDCFIDPRHRGDGTLTLRPGRYGQ